MSITPNLDSLQFDRESSYLITGGLGGLGKGLVTWMAARGAQHFILLSRTAGLKREDVQFIGDMEATGCSVLAIAGQAQNEEDVVAAVRAAQKPIRGVFHLAMVLRVSFRFPRLAIHFTHNCQDAQILDMKYSDWTSVIATKCTGAWNLHNILLSHSLDFFVLASSIAAQFPNVGQSNYAAANTFLEAFCQYRHSLSLPASVISICPIDDIGFVAENPDARKTLNAQGLSFLSQKEFLEYAELAVLNSYPEDGQVVDQDPNAIEVAHWNPLPVWHNSSHLIMGLRSTEPLSDNNTQTSWKHDRRMGFYHNVTAKVGSQRTNTNQLSRFISATRSDPAILKTKQAVEFLSMEIGIKIFKLMLRKEEEVELQMKIRDMGLDSLMAIELRRWWCQIFRVEISVLEIMGKENLVELGELAANRMRERHLGET
jgi:NAD(P)-dependent dehydrogenase (short-subunit alcohol dehydrogenase family)